jgi:hypothetical protein
MTDLEQALARWLGADVIDAATAERIRSFEGRAPSPVERPGVLEAVVYLASAVIAVGVFVLVATSWEDLGVVLRVLIPAMGAGLAAVTGAAFGRSERSALHRGRQAVWLLATALITVTAAVAASEGGARAVWISVVAAAVAMVASIGCWTLSKTHLQVAGMAAACVLASLSAAALVGEYGNEDYAPFAAGVALVLFGLAAVAAVEAGMVSPVTTARIFGGLGAVVGAIYTGLDTGPAWGEAVAFAVAGVFVFGSLSRGVFTYMAVSVAVAFVGLATLILRHVEDATMVAVAFIAVGLALLAGIAVLERVRPWTRAATGARPRLAGRGPSRS